MSTKRQNLFLFFDEGEDENDISPKLVQLAMNRFVVDEDSQAIFSESGSTFLDSIFSLRLTKAVLLNKIINKRLSENIIKTEVSGIYYFKKTKNPVLNKNNPLYRSFVKQRTEKISYDEELVSDALEKAWLEKTGI